MNIFVQQRKEIFKITFKIIFELFKAFLIAYFIVVIFLPYLENWKYFNDTLKISNRGILLGSSGIIVLILLTTWSKVNTFWRKYKNTFKASKSKFTYIDFIFSTVYFSLILGIINVNKDLAISNEFKIFIFFNSTIFVFYFFSSYYWFRNTKNFSVESGHSIDDSSDRPIQHAEDDLLDRDVFVQGLYKEIKELKMSDSFVFGLYANWGEGKSSVLNILRNLLNKDSNFIIMNFEPWNFKDEEAILKAFFSSIEKSINSEYSFPHLKKLLYKYQKVISSGLENFGYKIDFSNGDVSIEEIKGKIEAYIESTEKKLVIIIDEIDRLQEDEIRLVFKLVRSNSNFKNSIFLLSLDDIRTAEKLREHGTKFLEKIVQKPILLPKSEQNFIDRFLLFSDHKIPMYTINELANIKIDTLVSSFGFVTSINGSIIEINETIDHQGKTILIQLNDKNNGLFKVGDKLFVEGIKKRKGIVLNDPEAHIIHFKLSKIDTLLEKMYRDGKISLEQIKYFDREFVYLYKNQVSNLIENLRDAKRFMNSLSSSYPPIAFETSPLDFISLEVIKVFARKIYDDIFENWWFYVDKRFEGDTFSNPYAFIFSSEQDKKKAEIDKHINSLLDLMNLELRHRDAIKRILEILFPNVRSEFVYRGSDEEKGRISSVSFIKYFTLKVPSTEISYKLMEDTLNSWQENASASTISTAIIQFKSIYKLVEFLDKLNRIYINQLSPDILIILIKVISNNIKDFSRKDNEVMNSEYDRGLTLVINILNTRIDKNKIESLIIEIILKTSDLLFAVDLILITKRDSNRGYENIYENIDHNVLKLLLSERLEKYYIKEKRNIFKENYLNKGCLRILYQWSSYWSNDITPNKNKVGIYIADILKNDVTNLIKFLKSFNTGSFEAEWDMNYDQYSKVYNLIPIAKLSKKLLKRKSITQEQKLILEKFVSKVESNTKLR